MVFKTGWAAYEAAQDIIQQLLKRAAKIWDTNEESIEYIDGVIKHKIDTELQITFEEIAGLLTALRLFVDETPDTRYTRWLKVVEIIVQATGEMPSAQLIIATDRKRYEIPTVELHLNEETTDWTALNLVIALQNGAPAIQANPSRVNEGIVVFGPTCLKDDEPAIIGQRLRELLLQ